jgi:hypothetical protein
LTVAYGKEGQPEEMVDTTRKVPSDLEDDLYDAGFEPHLELVRNSLKLIKAKSISYQLDTNYIYFYERR